MKLKKMKLLKLLKLLRKETEALRKETEALRKETKLLRKETEALRKETKHRWDYAAVSHPRWLSLALAGDLSHLPAPRFASRCLE